MCLQAELFVTFSVPRFGPSSCLCLIMSSTPLKMLRLLFNRLIYLSWESWNQMIVEPFCPCRVMLGSFRGAFLAMLMWLPLASSYGITTQTSHAGEATKKWCKLFFSLGGALNYCAVCPLCTWVAQLGSVPVLWGGYTVVPWSLPHLLPYAPVQVTSQDELHQLATDRENPNLSWLPDICLLQSLEVPRFLVPTSHVFLLDELVLVWGASVTRVGSNCSDWS